jgi:hypothetical protein
VIVAQLKEGITQELFDWLICQPPELYHKLPVDARESLIWDGLPLKTWPYYVAPCPAERRHLRPGEHYNVLLGVPSGSSLSPSHNQR